MKDTVNKFIDWSVSVRIKKRYYYNDTELDIVGKLPTTYQDDWAPEREFPTCRRCTKCDWNIGYCEPHWETNTRDYGGHIKDRRNAKLYHLNCYKKNDPDDFTVVRSYRYTDKSNNANYRQRQKHFHKLEYRHGQVYKPLSATAKKAARKRKLILAARSRRR